MAATWPTHPHPRPSHPRSLQLAPTLKSAGAAMVWDCTGVFLTRDKLAPYFDAAGAKKVVVSAPVKDPNPVLNVVMGCNHVSTLVA